MLFFLQSLCSPPNKSLPFHVHLKCHPFHEFQLHSSWGKKKKKKPKKKKTKKKKKKKKRWEYQTTWSASWEMCMQVRKQQLELALKHVKYHVWNELPVQVRCTILDAWGWCTGTTQRDGMGREEGGGFRMWNTCIPVADSFWYLAKLIQLCKV